LQSFDFAGLPLGEQLETNEQMGGLASYLVRLRLDASRLSVGEHSATIRVNTTSRFRPIVEIPVRFTIAHEVKARPSILEFARAPTDALPVAVTLQHRNDKPLRISGLETPVGIRAVVEEQGSRAILKVSVVHAGETRTGVVKLRASWDGGEEPLEIPFYYFAAA